MKRNAQGVILFCANPKFNLVFAQAIWQNTHSKTGQTFHDDMANGIRAIERITPDGIGRKAIIYSGRETSTSDGIRALPFNDFTI